MKQIAFALTAFLLAGSPALSGCAGTTKSADAGETAKPSADSKERKRPQKKRDIDIEKEFGSDYMEGPGLFTGKDGGYYLIGEPGDGGEGGEASRKREDGPVKVRERR